MGFSQDTKSGITERTRVTLSLGKTVAVVVALLAGSYKVTTAVWDYKAAQAAEATAQKEQAMQLGERIDGLSAEVATLRGELATMRQRLDEPRRRRP